MWTLLGILIIALVLIIIFQITKATEYIGEMRDEKSSHRGSDKSNGRIFIWFLIIGGIATVWSVFHYLPTFLPEPSSVHGHWIRSMFQWTLLPTAIIFVLTHIVLFYFAWRYRSSEKNKSRVVHFADSTKLEIIWTAIPAVVMVALVFVGLVNWNKITGDPPADSIIIEATGRQFAWDIRYSGADNELGTKTVHKIEADNPLGMNWDDKRSVDDFMADTLVIPVDANIFMKLNSIDVLHSFYLPHFRVKMDCVPGIPTRFWFTPTKTTKQMREETGDRKFNYELACAELCGASHWNMRKPVKVVTKEEYESWLTRQTTLYKKLGIAEKLKEEKKRTAEMENILKVVPEDSGDKKSTEVEIDKEEIKKDDVGEITASLN